MGTSTSNNPSEEEIRIATQQAIQLQQQAHKLIKENLINNFFETQYSKKDCLYQRIAGKSDQVKGCISNIIPSASQRISTQNEQGKRILIFVSFSMPEISLKGLAQDAQQHNAVLVMRGLYQDSFVKTAQKLQELGVTIDINPELFEKHHISSVPAFILLKDGHSIFNLKGNVTLNFVAREFDNYLLKDQPNFRRAS